MSRARPHAKLALIAFAVGFVVNIAVAILISRFVNWPSGAPSTWLQETRRDVDGGVPYTIRAQAIEGRGVRIMAWGNTPIYNNTTWTGTFGLNGITPNRIPPRPQTRYPIIMTPGAASSTPPADTPASSPSPTLTQMYALGTQNVPGAWAGANPPQGIRIYNGLNIGPPKRWAERRLSRAFDSVERYLRSEPQPGTEPPNSGKSVVYGWPWPFLEASIEVSEKVTMSRGAAPKAGPGFFDPFGPLVARPVPLYPQPRALTAGALFWGAIVFVFLETVRLPFVRFSMLRRYRRGLCPNCKYDLAHDYRQGCPECGWRRNVANTQPNSETLPDPS